MWSEERWFTWKSLGLLLGSATHWWHNDSCSKIWHLLRLHPCSRSFCVSRSHPRHLYTSCIPSTMHVGSVVFLHSDKRTVFKSHYFLCIKDTRQKSHRAQSKGPYFWQYVCTVDWKRHERAAKHDSGWATAAQVGMAGALSNSNEICGEGRRGVSGAGWGEERTGPMRWGRDDGSFCCCILNPPLELGGPIWAPQFCDCSNI